MGASFERPHFPKYPAFTTIIGALKAPVLAEG